MARSYGIWPVYSEDPAWADVDPIPQDDGGPNPLAAIAYTDEYSEAMAYLRAVMAEDELSERALELTKHIISLNPAHYTVWLYRARTLLALDKDLREEIGWLNTIALRYEKNYQIWHHRQGIVERLGDPSGEEAFIAQMFEKDAKNYHVWSYRQWLVRHFSLWDSELPTIEGLLESDVRNNSAWNHRYYVVFGRDEVASEEEVEREVQYAMEAICIAPQNQSPWNYLRGVLRQAGKPLSTIRVFTSEFADLARPEEVRSSHALDVLADIYAEAGTRGDAEAALDLLAQKYDPVRANYWNYKKRLLGASGGSSTPIATA
ncbi:MAG: CAAX geranylgeranyltransferase alpha subunit [Thelocarpon impressellum]|nr:MAG: CAAX geranylgeranyltransferase alpha subunit [Thelocarpon impressellum]